MQRSVVHMYMPAFVARSCTALPEEKSKASYPYLILVKLILFEETFDQTKLLIITQAYVGSGIVTPHKTKSHQLLVRTISGSQILFLTYSFPTDERRRN